MTDLGSSSSSSSRRLLIRPNGEIPSETFVGVPNETGLYCAKLRIYIYVPSNKKTGRGVSLESSVMCM